MICEIVQKCDLAVEKIPFADNLVNPFTKTLTRRVFDDYKDNIGVRCVPSML